MIKKSFVFSLLLFLLSAPAEATHLPTTWYGWLFASSNQLRLRKLERGMYGSANLNQQEIEDKKTELREHIERYNPLNPLDVENQPLLYTASLLPLAGWLYERYQMRAYGARFIWCLQVPTSGIGWFGAGIAAALMLVLGHVYDI